MISHETTTVCCCCCCTPQIPDAPLYHKLDSLCNIMHCASPPLKVLLLLLLYGYGYGSGFYFFLFCCCC